MHSFRQLYILALLVSLSFFAGSAACNPPAPNEDTPPPEDGFSRFPAVEPGLETTPEVGQNPWIVGFGGANPTEGGPTGDQFGQEHASGNAAGGADSGADGATGGARTNEIEGGSVEVPVGSGAAGDPEGALPLIERRLVRYLEGDGSDKLLGLWGEAGISPVECRIEIYSNGGVTPWRTIPLPNEFPEGGFLTLCSIPENHPECTVSMSGSLYNGNDALLLMCGEVVMDSFGRVGEDPGAAWTSNDETLSSEGQDLLRCGETPRTDPFAAFFLADDWVLIQNGESLEEARLKCAPFEAPIDGGAGAFAL